MAQDAADSVKFYLRVEKAFQNDLAELRAWANLKVAIEADEIWVTNFTYDQIHSTIVKQIPFKTLYYAKNGKLFFLNSRLPEKKEPQFLWTPIVRATPLSLVDYNHNYFGVNESIDIAFVQSEIEQNPAAILTDLSILNDFIQNAPAVRLANLKWCLINESKALIIGSPLLPINGKVFWKSHLMFLPTGWNFELSIAADLIENLINEDKLEYILWNEQGQFSRIPIASFQSLSISSFRKSVTADGHKILLESE
ncbi:MAG: hypothetical protein GQ574_04520 [Crocinitomix sp.]|nr:hypothetical protein [Crocinitomix sp.]